MASFETVFPLITELLQEKLADVQRYQRDVKKIPMEDGVPISQLDRSRTPGWGPRWRHVERLQRKLPKEHLRPTAEEAARWPHHLERNVSEGSLMYGGRMGHSRRLAVDAYPRAGGDVTTQKTPRGARMHGTGLTPERIQKEIRQARPTWRATFDKIRDRHSQ